MTAGALVLVVEDNPLNRKLLVRLLEAKGYRVAQAASTREAEARLGAGEPPALVLMDVSLPGEDGLALVRRMRAGAHARVPVIAVTAHAMPGDRERALAAGCEDYVTKPVELADLLLRVARLTGVGA